MTDAVVQAHLNKIRKDKFKMIFNIPNILRTINLRGLIGQDTIDMNTLQISLYNATIPSVSVPEIQLHYAGQNSNISSYNRPPYEPMTVNFEVDNQFKNYWVMWKWLELFNDPTLSTYGDKGVFPDGYPVMKPETKYDYTTNIDILALNEYNAPVVTFKFRDAFPTKLGELDFNYREDEQLSTNFTFVYNQMDIVLPEPT